MSKVIITGANGFVGNHLVSELSRSGYEVIGIGGPRQPGMKDPEGLSEYLVIDLNDPEAVRQIDFRGVMGVVHLAGLAAVGPSFDEPLKYVSVNVGLQVNIMEEALRQQANPKFVIISSGTLYDPHGRLPITEECPVFAGSPYAVSKISQEEMGKYYHMRGMEVVIARAFNHVGPGQNLGFIVPDLTKQVVDVERGTAHKVLVGNLDAERDYTDVRDIAHAYRLLLEKGCSGEIYNVCSGQSHSGQTILEAILAVSGGNPQIEQDPTRMRPADNPVLYGSYEKLTKDTGWQPEIPLETTIADVVADWRSRS